MPKMLTPRMLARTLFVLRHTRAGIGLDVLGRSIDISDSHLNRLERRQATIHYEHIEKYQLFFGVPNGIVLVISHMAAMARDVAQSYRRGDEPRGETEKRKLNLMALYLRNLADRIDPPKSAVRSSKPRLAEEGAFPGVTDDPSTWDPLLLDLILAAQTGIDPTEPTAFQDLERLREVIQHTRSPKA